MRLVDEDTVEGGADRRLGGGRPGIRAGDVRFVAGSPCETMLNVDHCFVRDDLRSRALQLPSTRGLGIVSDHRYVLSLSLGGVVYGEKKTLRLPRYRISLLGDQLRTDAVRREGGRRTGHRRDLRRLMSDVERRGAQVVAVCQQVSEAALGKRPDKPRKCPLRKGPDRSRSIGSEDDGGMLGSIRLYKRTARTSQENGPLLPTESGRLKGLSAIEEVVAGLSEHFSSDSPGFATLDDALEPDDAIQDYVSVEEIVEELRHQGSNKACGMDGVHICLMQALTSTSFVQVLAALYDSCVRYAKTPGAWNDTIVCLIVKDHTRPKDADNVRPITLIGMFRKVFERLLLRRLDAGGWAKAQPTQAGFRSHCSTCVNAAVLHALLESGRITHVVFLDFKAAFDVVDHAPSTRFPASNARLDCEPDIPSHPFSNRLCR